MAKQHHTWLIWPRNASTNETLARFSLNCTNGFEEDAIRDTVCADGKKRNFWRINSFDSALFLWKSRYDLKFSIFSQKGKTLPRDVTELLFRKERRKPKFSRAKAKCN